MNNLKKVLVKDDLAKYQKKINQNLGNLTKLQKKSIINRHNWTDINQLIECRSTFKKTVQTAVEQKFKSLIKKSFHLGQLIISSEILISSFISIFEQYRSNKQLDQSRSRLYCQQQKIQNVLLILQKLLYQEAKYQKQSPFQIFIQQLQKCLELAQKYRKDQAAKIKKKQLDDFDKIIEVLRLPKKKVDKQQNIQNATKKLIHSLSSGYLHIRITTQQIYFTNNKQKYSVGKFNQKKSEKKIMRVQSEKRSKSPKNESRTKLMNFLKDGNTKLVKTKVEYDFNAILEGSKSNIHYRKKCSENQSHSKIAQNESLVSMKNNFQVSNINKAKKDQGFVFYRPKIPRK